MKRITTVFLFLIAACTSFSQLVIPYQRNDLWGLVERGVANGILTPRYPSMTPLGNGYFDVSQRDSIVAIIDSTGKETISLPYNITLFTGNGLFRYTNNEGDHIWYHVSGRKLQIDSNEVEHAGKCFSGRLMYANHKGKEGFLDVYGNIVIKADYDEVSGFYKGYSIVRLGKKVGAIDSTGKIVIPLIYDAAKPLGNDLFAVNKNKKTAVANKNNILLTKFEFDYIHDFYEGVAWVMKGTQRWYINEKGQAEWAKKFKKISSFENGVAIVNDGKNDILINRKGEVLYKAPVQYMVKGAREGTFFELEDKKTGKYLIANKYGKPLFTGMSELPHQGTRSYMVVERDGKMGLINELGELKLSLNFDRLVYVKELDIWYAVKDVDYGYIDEFGQKYWVKK